MLQIHQNQHTKEVVEDLRLICPDPGLGFNVSKSTLTFGSDQVSGYDDGRVFYAQSRSSVGCEVVATLVNKTSCRVLIRGEPSGWATGSGTETIAEIAGGCWSDQYPNPTLIYVIYDAPDCNGRGHVVHDSAGKEIPYPRHVCLFHELAHAYLLCTGSFSLAMLMDPSDPNVTASAELDAIRWENDFRVSLSPPLPKRFGHTGKCNPAAATGGATKPAGKSSSRRGCFVATAAYGSELDPHVAGLRSFRDEVLRTTRTGATFFDRFYSRYAEISDPIVAAIESDPDVRELVRAGIVGPLVEQLRSVVELPDGNVDELPPEWREWALTTRSRIERWVGDAIEFPTSFSGLPVVTAARELAVLLRYALRHPESRNAYLDRLEAASEIPLLGGSPTERRGARVELERLGVSPRLIDRVLPTSPATAEGVGGDAGMTSQEYRKLGALRSDEWLYTVNITNAPTSSEAFDEVVIFYKSSKITDGVVFLREVGIIPGETRTFSLGVCSEMVSYVVGIFDGPNLEVTIPDEGAMTPALAAQIKAAAGVQDAGPCADSWTIEVIIP